MCGLRKPIRYSEMILDLVASFSQKDEPAACHGDLIQVQISNYNFCVNIYSENVNFKLDFCSFGRCLEGIYPYTKKRIECLHLLTRGYGGSIVYQRYNFL